MGVSLQGWNKVFAVTLAAGLKDTVSKLSEKYCMGCGNYDFSSRSLWKLFFVYMRTSGKYASLMSRSLVINQIGISIFPSAMGSLSAVWLMLKKRESWGLPVGTFPLTPCWKLRRFKTWGRECLGAVFRAHILETEYSWQPGMIQTRLSLSASWGEANASHEHLKRHS